MGIVLSLVVIAGSTSVPIMYNKYNEERLNTLLEFSELFKEVAHEVRYLLTPLPQALKKAKAHRCSAVNKAVDDFLYGLERCNLGGTNVDKIWSGAIAYNKTNLKLTEKECDVICQFGEYMAFNNYSIKAIDNSMLLVVERIDELAKQSKAKHERYAPMYNKLGLLGGLALSVFTI